MSQGREQELTQETGGGGQEECPGERRARGSAMEKEGGPVQVLAGVWDFSSEGFNFLRSTAKVRTEV